jgi:hypothetical protein
VIIGFVMFVIAGVSWKLARADEAPLLAYAAAGAGVLGVGILHSRLWRNDPWARRAKGARLSHRFRSRGSPQ